MTNKAQDHNPERLVYGFDTCGDCGEHTCRRLPDRSPHVCSTCLFPPRGKDGEDVQVLEPLVWTDLLAMLHATVAGHNIKFFKSFRKDGKNLDRYDGYL